MRMRRVIIRAILALSAAGSILAGSAVTVTVAQAPSTYALAAPHPASFQTHFWA